MKLKNNVKLVRHESNAWKRPVFFTPLYEHVTWFYSRNDAQMKHYCIWTNGLYVYTDVMEIRNRIAEIKHRLADCLQFSKTVLNMQTDLWPTTSSKLVRDYTRLLLLSRSLWLYLQLRSCVHTPYFNERQTVWLVKKRKKKKADFLLVEEASTLRSTVCDGFLSEGPVPELCLGLFGPIISTKAPCRLNKSAPRPLNPQDKPTQPLSLPICHPFQDAYTFCFPVREPRLASCVTSPSPPSTSLFMPTLRKCWQMRTGGWGLCSCSLLEPLQVTNIRESREDVNV